MIEMMLGILLAAIGIWAAHKRDMIARGVQIEVDWQSVLCCVFLFIVLAVAYGPVIRDFISGATGET